MNFIGEDLNEKQIAALQAVADRCCGTQFASIDGVKEEAEKTPRRYRCLYNKNDEVPLLELNRLLVELEVEGLVQFKMIKHLPHVGLTDDGLKCNLIEVF